MVWDSDYCDGEGRVAGAWDSCSHRIHSRSSAKHTAALWALLVHSSLLFSQDTQPRLVVSLPFHVSTCLRYPVLSCMTGNSAHKLTVNISHYKNQHCYFCENYEWHHQSSRLRSPHPKRTLVLLWKIYFSILVKHTQDYKQAIGTSHGPCHYLWISVSRIDSKEIQDSAGNDLTPSCLRNCSGRSPVI